MASFDKKLQNPFACSLEPTKISADCFFGVILDQLFDKQKLLAYCKFQNEKTFQDQDVCL